jgi:hypothetical protein
LLYLINHVKIEKYQPHTSWRKSPDSWEVRGYSAEKHFLSGGFMQTSAPLTAKDAKKIALRRGLFFGISAGCISLLITAFSRVYYNSNFFVEFSLLIMLLTFFMAGASTIKKTNRLDMAARAGFWAGMAVGLFHLGSTFLLVYHYSASMSGSSMLLAVLETIPESLLALIIGPVVGMGGGLMSNKSGATSISPPPSSTQPTNSPMPPPQPSPTTVQSAPTVPTQPAQPSPPQQQA